MVLHSTIKNNNLFYRDHHKAVTNANVGLLLSAGSAFSPRGAGRQWLVHTC